MRNSRLLTRWRELRGKRLGGILTLTLIAALAPVTTGRTQEPPMFRAPYRLILEGESIPSIHGADSGAVADFDRDGCLDLATISGRPATVNILSCPGSGPTATVESFRVSAADSWIVSGEINGDEDPDLVLTSFNHFRGTPRITTLFGNGDATFQVGETLALEAYLVTRCILRDMDGDGLDDLLLLDGAEDSQLSVRLARPGGEFGPATSYTTVSGPFVGIQSFAADDLDQDGLVDVVVARGDRALFFPGMPGGMLGEVEDLEVDPFRSLHGLRIADIDDDGRLDLLLGGRLESPANARLVTLHGADGGGFTEPLTVFSSEEAGTLTFEFADLDRSGDLEIILAFVIEGHQRFHVLDREGESGSFSISDTIRGGVGTERFFVDDFNGEGRLDLIAINRGNSIDVSVIPGIDGSGESHPQIISVEVNVTDYKLLDLDSDNLPDLLVQPDFPRDAPPLYLSNVGEGELAPPRELQVPSLILQRYSDVLDAIDSSYDFNDDDLLDLLFVEDGRVSVAAGRTSHSFGIPAETNVRLEPGRLAIDMDNDGNLDVLGVGGDFLTFVPGNGDLTFGESRRYFMSPRRDSIRASAIGDFDNDQRPDVALMLSQDQGNYVSIFLDPLTNEYSVTQKLRVPLASGPLAAADFNLDGRLDLAGSQNGLEVVYILLGQGDGTFDLQSPRRLAGYGSQGSPARIDAVDLNGDARAELVLANRSGGFIDIVENLGGGELGSQIRLDYPSRYIPSIMDFNGDGRPDIFSRAGTRPDEPFFVLLNASTGEILDCDENGMPDPLDISSGAAFDCDGDGILDRCEIASDPELDRDGNGFIDSCENGLQVPGDCNQDAILDTSDALCLLGHLFLGNPEALPCMAGPQRDSGNRRLMDVSEDASVDLTDAIAILGFLFLGGEPHPLAVGGNELRGCTSILGCQDSPGCAP